MDIIQIIKGLNGKQLAKETGIPYERIAKWRQGKGYPKAEDMKILEGYLGTNSIDDSKDQNEENIQISLSNNKKVIPIGKHIPLRLKADEYAEAFGDWQGLPMYNMPINASFVEMYHDGMTYTPQYYLHDPRFRDCDFGAIITGDSMYSEIRHGDFVACKEINDPSFLVYGEIYYVVANNGLETCKYVNAGKDEDHILLVPRNEKISPSPIRKDMIKSIFKVRGIIRSY